MLSATTCKCHTSDAPVKPWAARRHGKLRATRVCTARASTQPPLVIVGSINVDLVLPIDRIPVPGETVDGKDLQRMPGGKGANQAAAAAKLGYPTVMIGQVGDDSGADFMLRELQQAGVSTEGTVRVVPGAPTGAALILLQPGGENSIIIVGGANAAEWSITDAQAATITRAGAVLLQREIPDAVNLEVAELCLDAGVPVILDAGGADGPLDAALLRCLTTLSPNETELARMTGMATDTREHALAAARKLLGMGPTNVLVKRGKQGSLMVTDDGSVHEQPAIKAAKVVDTTGAGDCYTGAFAIATLRGKSTAEAMLYAAQASSICVQRLGAMSSLPTFDEVEQLIHQ